MTFVLGWIKMLSSKEPLKKLRDSTAATMFSNHLPPLYRGFYSTIQSVMFFSSFENATPTFTIFLFPASYGTI